MSLKKMFKNEDVSFTYYAVTWLMALEFFLQHQSFFCLDHEVET